MAFTPNFFCWSISDDLIQMLNSVSGRKHLTAAQAKQLRHLLPVIQLLQHLISSSVFRLYTVNEMFMTSVGRLLEHTVSVDSGETGVTSTGR